MRAFLKEARKKKNLTQRDVAKAAGMNRVVYCEIENGKRNPSVKLAKKLGQILDVDWSEFYEEEN